MNEITQPKQFTLAGPPPPLPTTQAAEGTPRLRWTLEQFERLGDAGIFGEYDRLELIDGELVPMAAKGNRHENVRGKILLNLTQRLPIGHEFYSELGWRPGGNFYCEPEIVICRTVQEPSTLAPGDVLLLIEVAVSSLAYDTGLKMRTYSGLGVREYWVVNAVTLETTVYREPTAGGYGSQVKVPANEIATPHLVPELAIQLAELGLG
jgi:Uma2 family endonuclease